MLMCININKKEHIKEIKLTIKYFRSSSRNFVLEQMSIMGCFGSKIKIKIKNICTNICCILFD
jgi:hypothetical protein